ncbi:hypothetical protein [Burkholderia sp.]|uniref:hypothetical protein n=1 Tax=Burkholderia sp. TaxID=36773 RepID=UPI0025C21A7C|nr:hypothetical protein [Burkholderia sp.]MBS6362126.1 hypothetical protein [Burkholderia sp.]
MKVTINGHLFAQQKEDYDYGTGRIVGTVEYSFWECDMSKSFPEYVKVCDHSFEVEVPDGFDPRSGIVANLEREKAEVTAKFQARITEINGRIQSLLAIENKPSEVAT